MFPRILHIHGPLYIRGYGLMLAIGLILFVFLTYKNPFRKKIISHEQFFNTIFIGLLSGIIGGRFLFVIFEYDAFRNNLLEIFYPWVGGFSMLGAIPAVIITVALFLKKKSVPIISLLDLAAIYAPLIEAFGRIGCFLAGCCYGMPTKASNWFSVTFTNPNCLGTINTPLYPTQIYSSIASLLSFILLYRLYIIAKKHNGALLGSGLFLCVYLDLASLFRFIIDFWR